MVVEILLIMLKLERVHKLMTLQSLNMQLLENFAQFLGRFLLEGQITISIGLQLAHYAESLMTKKLNINLFKLNR